MSSMQISVGVGKEAACLALEEEKRETHKWVITEIHLGQLWLFTISVTFHHSLLMSPGSHRLQATQIPCLGDSGHFFYETDGIAASS